jgi:hypothetical protein
LSVKVFAGQCRLNEQGYRQGGAAGYALRRPLIDEHSNRKGELSRGEQKGLQTDRVVLVLGPDLEQHVVNPRDMWIRAEATRPAIVHKALFLRAREVVDARSQHFTDAELAKALRAELKQKGVLSGLIIRVSG